MRIVVCALVLAVAAGLPAGAVKYVDKNNPGCNDLGPGTPPVPYCTIQRGYDQALDGEQVRVLPGTYNECLLAYSLVAPKNVEIVADAWLLDPTNNTATILDAGADPTCNYPYGGPAAGVNIAGFGPTGSAFRGFTVRDGTNGGILAVGSVAITNNVVTGSDTLNWGGGIYLYTANCYYGDIVATIAGNDVRNNTAQDGGGGIAITAGYEYIVQSPYCTLDGDSLVTVQGNTVVGNSTEGSGGGINVTSFTNNFRVSRIVITQNTITGNIAGTDTTIAYGGGIYGLAYGYGTEIIDATFNTVAGNSAEDRGGGISISSFPDVVALSVDHHVRVEDNTVTGNTGERGGGGIDLLANAFDLNATQTIDIAARRNVVTGNRVTRDNALSEPVVTFKGGGGISALLEAEVSTSPGIRMTLENNRITDNSSKIYGGGVAAHAVADGDVPGRLAPAKARMRLVGNLIARNTVDSQVRDSVGGGVFAYLEAQGSAEASIDLELDTIAANTLDNTVEAGGVHAESFTSRDRMGIAEGRATLSLTSSIVARNDGMGYGGPAPGAAGILTPGGTGELDATSFDYNDVFGHAIAFDFWLLPGAGHLEADPRFVNAAAGDFHLASSSPAIDAGDPGIAGAPPLDADGDARIADGNGDGIALVDMGYDEAKPGSPPVPLDVRIDIKPGTFPNVVNILARGVLPVAILGSADLDVTSIDVTSLRFGPDEAAPAHDLLDPETYLDHLQDVDADGFVDLVTHYWIAALGLGCDATEATLTASTTSGDELQGTDSLAATCRPPGRRSPLEAGESLREAAEGTTVDIAPR